MKCGDTTRRFTRSTYLLYKSTETDDVLSPREKEFPVAERGIGDTTSPEVAVAKRPIMRDVKSMVSR